MPKRSHLETVQKLAIEDTDEDDEGDEEDEDHSP